MQFVWVVADLWTAPDGPGKPIGKVVVVGFYALDQVSVATAFVEVSGEGEGACDRTMSTLTGHDKVT